MERYIIICKNTVAKPVLLNNRNLASTKNKKKHRGLGHQIIETTAEKYGGFVDYFEKDGFFGIHISLPEQTNK